ncbi:MULTISPECIES: hypothetical protein [unclassified Lentimonas]|uniref:hypothetical protein n=1 Tax=unclassified Lentimonas TaxID=2630993 RepID=UPI001322B86B|nr:MULTISPECIES: hypothetical protein [unclassified Lentimonas]CAA6680113.1 Unannotated [Lentimonas sp. CC4]CAA6685093.1 Unannotated [Lentimonas sp. CC6]CAA6697448.1 Unannotated [Lentimonas sp. CC19]CAA6697740.1 Unannotated [Lentimonas sp. CC10]CAA7072494.1 Unannotated [Lentimonas sp. CC11]
MIEITPIIEGTVTGISGAFVLGLLALGWKVCRNYMLGRKIDKGMKRIGMGSGIHGINTSVGNDTEVSFTVREVYLVAGKVKFRFNPTEEVSTYWYDKKKFKKKELQEGVQETVVEFKPLFSGKIPSGSDIVTIEPYTRRGYLLPAGITADIDESKVTELEFILEYVDFSGKHRIKSHRSDIQSNVFSRKNIESYMEQLRDGRLNKARKLFQLPPIKIKAQPAAGDNA